MKLPSAEEWAKTIHTSLIDYWSTEAAVDMVMVNVVEHLLARKIRADRNAVLEAAAEVAEAAQDEAYAIGITGWIAAEIRKLKAEPK